MNTPMDANQTPHVLSNTVNVDCPSCGSNLRYDADKKKIACNYCGYLEDINQENDLVIEKILSKALELKHDFEPIITGKKVFDCQNCGAKFTVEQDKVKVSCGFCGSKNVNTEAYQDRYIQPVGIIPFMISRKEGEAVFRKWIKQGAFHPSKLKSLANVEELHGVYIPFWTFDAQTESDWSGDAGTYYYETKTVRVGGQVQKKQVRKTRWRRRSGHLSHFFDDVLVVASHGIEQKSVERILPYKLEEVINFDPRLMVGWEAEVYQMEIDQGFSIADSIIDNKLRRMCSHELGGDTQRNLHVSSQKSDHTFKHIILPLWICSYTYQNKIYHFTINGQTGKVYGKKPISYIKIAGVVLFLILLIVAVYYLRESGILKKG